MSAFVSEPHALARCFDMVVPVTQPTLDAKLEHWQNVATRKTELQIDFSNVGQAMIKTNLDAAQVRCGRSRPVGSRNRWGVCKHRE